MNTITAPSSASHRARIAELGIVFARWILALVLIYMGVMKAANPIEFLKVVRQYDVIQNHLPLNLVAATIPWFEIYCGVLLLLGVCVRGTALVVLTILAAFTVAVALRALSIREAGSLPFCAIKFDCGCGAGEVLACRKLGENLLLMMLSATLIFAHNHRLCLRRSLT